MVTRISHSRRVEAMLIPDLLVAMAILVIAVIPLSFSFRAEQKLCHQYYCRAVLVEVANGELEKLAAGDWRHYKQGRQPFNSTARVMKNLHGAFTLDVQSDIVRLEWVPEQPGEAGRFVKEAQIK